MKENKDDRFISDVSESTKRAEFIFPGNCKIKIYSFDINLSLNSLKSLNVHFYLSK